MNARFPTGFSGHAVHAGIKQTAGKEDVALVVSDRPRRWRRRLYAEPGLRCTRPRLIARLRQATRFAPWSSIRASRMRVRAIVATRIAPRWRPLVADACGLDDRQTLVLSTGVIGVHLPMDKIAAGIERAAANLASDNDALERTARGMMTTDTVPKIRGRDFDLDGVKLNVTGLAKGAAMIGPNMATMLAIVMTDANVFGPRRACRAKGCR